MDDDGYIFTPTALYLESEQRETDAPNALRLSVDQVAEIRARLSPAAKAIALVLAKTSQERARISEQVVEIISTEVTEVQFAEVSQKLIDVPPVPFDVARQVRVFEPYLQYVELRLSGVAIQRRRIRIPRNIQNLGDEEGVQSRFETTFDLIERESALSSKPIEDELNEIGNNLTPSLGKEHGRVLLKAKKSLLEKRLNELRTKLETFQVGIKQNLQTHLDVSREEVVNYYLPRVIENPPDAFSGQLLTDKPTEADAIKWLNRQFDPVFPTAEQLINTMNLDISYKDVTFETLNSDDFLPLIQEAFPDLNWKKAYEEFRAAGEKST